MKESKGWLVPLTGLAFVVLAIISFVVGGEPKDATHPAAEIVSWYVDHKDSVMASAFIGVAATVLLVFFGAYLREVLRAAGGGAMLSLVSFIGIVVVAIGLAFDTTIQIAISERADDIDPIAVQSLQALWDNDFVPIALGILLFLWATGISVVRTGALPKWIGWIMLALGVIALTPIGFASFIGTALLILVISILLSARARAGATASA
ncbi:MAG TPA: hypothetical protein VH391_04635 [Solirubrobacterales bacterium]